MLHLYNSMTRRKEPFASREEGIVRMFTCGPSIYGRPHLGNYRTFAWEDVLQRYLEHLGYTVHRLMNMTDVEDKALMEAEKAGTSVQELTEEKAELFLRDARTLRIRLPNPLPRSSTSIDQAVRLIKVLMKKGYAYEHNGDIFYDPLKFKGFGRLFGLDMNRWPKVKRRFRKDTYPGRRWNLGDFILWHGYREGDTLFWDTDIGRGRPSWNIQDPAMVTEHLGYSIDIACGGIDNVYRHHDYNIAVIEGVSGSEFARFWIHGEHLLANGKKMSKSLGNIVYPEGLQKDGYSGDHIRFYLIHEHHRKRMNLTPKNVANQAAQLESLRRLVRELLAANGPTNTEVQATAPSTGAIDSLVPNFERHMNDDLNVKRAIDGLHENLLRLTSLKRAGHWGEECVARAELELRRIDRVIQVLLPEGNEPLGSERLA